MAFEKIKLVKNSRKKLRSVVRSRTLTANPRQTRISIAEDICQKLSLAKRDRVGVLVGTGKDLGWICIDPSGDSYSLFSAGKGRTLNFVVTGLETSKSDTVDCPHHIKGGKLYVNIPFLKQAPVALAKGA